jgi:hypothetical protein
MIEIPRGPARSYLIVSGAATIYIATASSVRMCGSPGRKTRVIVGTTRDLWLTLCELRKKFPDAAIVYAMWAKDIGTAKRVVTGVRDDYAEVYQAEAALALRMMRCNVVLTEHHIVMLRVRRALERINAKITAANKSGQLRWFNRAYRASRLQAKENGCGMVPYFYARTKLRNEMVKQLISLKVIDCQPDLITRVLPEYTD